MPIALYALALAAFAVGTAEFIIAGLLPTMAADLSVSIPTAGLLISGYALSVAIGGPILALLTAHLPRRPMILVTVALYAIGHVACALAPNYDLLLASRIIVALTHGLFFGNATIAAANVVPAERRGAAISIVLPACHSPICSACRSAPPSATGSAGAPASGASLASGPSPSSPSP